MADEKPSDAQIIAESAPVASDAEFDPVLDGEIPFGQPPQAEPAAPRADDRPRGPDGKFLPVAPKHDPDLAEMALSLGMTQSDIDRTAPADLPRFVKFAHHQSLQQSSRQAQAAPAPPPPPPLELPEELAESLDPAFKEFLTRQTAEVRSLRAEIAAGEQRRVNETNTQHADRLFAEHGDPVKVGSGGVTSLKQSSDEQINRLAVVNMACLLAGNGATAAQQIAKIPDALKRLGMVKGLADQSEDEVAAQLQKRRVAWANGGVPPSSHRKGAMEQLPKGEDRAMKAVAEKLIDKRISERDFDSYEDTLPD